MKRSTTTILTTAALIWLFALPAEPVAQQTITLQQAFEIALENNHQIRSERIVREQSELDVSRANAGLLPTLSLEGNAEFSVQDATLEIADFNEDPPTVDRITVDGSESRFYNAGLQLRYTLFDGFSGRYRFRQLESAGRTAELSERLLIETTLLDVAAAYLELLRRSENRQILEDNVELSEDRKERVREDLRQGSATELDLLNAEVNLNADRSELVAGETAESTARRNLLLVMGLESDTQIEPSDDITIDRSLDLEEIMLQAAEQNTSLKIAREQTVQSGLNRDLATSSRYPSISLNGSYGYMRQEVDASNLPLMETTGFSAGITLRYDIFTGRQRSKEIQRAELGIRDSEVLLEGAEEELKTDIMNGYEQYSTSIQQLELTEVNAETAQRNFDRSREAFRQGQIRSVELREAQIGLLNEQIRLNDLSYRASEAELQLLLLSGNVTGSE